MSKLVNDYLRLKEGLWAEQTLEKSGHVLKSCSRFSESFDPRELYESLKAQGLSQYSIKTYLIICSQFKKQMMHNQDISYFLTENRFAFRNCYKDKLSRIQPEEYLTFLGEAPTDDIYNLFILLGRCGLRKSEALKAKWSDIENGYLKVQGKGSKVRHVPILQTWLRGSSEGDLKIVGSCKGCFYFFSKLKYNFHDFRAYFATQVANHPELNLKDAQLLLGHSSATTTMRYVRADLEKTKKVLCG